MGSAFALADGLAVTNAHVVEGRTPGEKVWVVPSTGDGGKIPAVVLAVSRRMDLAVLGIPAGAVRPVSRGSRTGRQGLQVVAAGTDAGRGLSPLARLELEGRVLVANRNIGAFGPGMIVSLPGVRPGFSGGPLLGLDGELVGMVTAIRPGSAKKPRVLNMASSRNGGDGGSSRQTDEAYVLRGPEIRAEVNRLMGWSGS